MEKTTPSRSTRSSSRSNKSWFCREKAKMAWRHRSRDEKILLRVIAFLVFALVCFIVAVTVMDLTYKAKIKKLEDQIDSLRTTTSPVTPNVTSATSELSTSASDDTTTSSANATTSTTTTTTTTSTTTTPSTSPSTTTPSSTDGSPIPGTAAIKKEVQTDEMIGKLLLAFVNKFGPTTASKLLDTTKMSDGVLKRTKASFILLADVQHEESSSPARNDTDDTTLDVDSSPPLLSSPGSEPNNITHSHKLVPNSDETDDEELNQEYSGDSAPTQATSPDEASAEHEGSGAGFNSFLSSWGF